VAAQLANADPAPAVHFDDHGMIHIEMIDPLSILMQLGQLGNGVNRRILSLVLELDPEAYDELVSLRDRDPDFADRVDEWLDRIEDDPTDVKVRRRLIRPGRVWVITVAGADTDYLILWDLDGDTPVIRYLGRDVAS
jgi:hypothetical protein